MSTPTPTPSNVQTNVQTNVQLIYQQLSPLITELVGTRQFSSDMVYPILSQVIQVIQTFSDALTTPLDGPTKQQIALNVLNMIIQALTTAGQISQPLSETLILALTVLGPALINFAAAAVKKVESEIEYIEANGCNGCYSSKSSKSSKLTKSK